MAVKFRSVSTATNTTGVDGTAVTVTLPAEVSDGDTLIAVTNGYTGDVFVPPAGWTFLGVFDDSTGLRSRAYKKIAASEPANYTFTFAGGGGAISVSVAAFISGYDVLSWAARVTSTTTPALGRDLDATRDSIGWEVYCWRNTTGDATVSWADGDGDEKHDVTSKATSAVWRGQSGTYYGPPDADDIVNAGDTLTAFAATPSVTPTHGVAWTFLVGDVEADTEPWSATDGDFAVEVRMDRVALDSTGDVTTRFAADRTGIVAAIAASNSGGGAAANAADGLRDTFWEASTATAWLRYDFGASNAQTVKRYRLTSSTSASRDPMDWTFEGSQNASSWTVIDTRTNQGFGNRMEQRELAVTTPGSYRYYRLNVSANKSSGVVSDVRLAEMRLSTASVWEDVTDYVQEEDKIRITRGLQGTSGRSDFSRAYFTLKNVDGRFSLRNPNGVYYGAIQRNSETRISKAYGTKALQLQGAVRIEGADVVGDCARAPLTSALSITGDIDIRIDLAADSWRGEQMLCGISSSAVHSWTLHMDDEGLLVFRWTPAGGSMLTATSTLAVPQSVRQTLRVTLDVNNGAAGNTTTFYTAPAIGGSFTQLGATVVKAGTTSIGYFGGALCVGHVASQAFRGLHGDVYNFELRTGIAGTLVSDIDFTALTNGAHAFTETSNNWVTVENAVVSNRRYRFHGEIASWPIAWDPTGNWIYEPITAAGVQKRLERGPATGSVMYRHHTRGVAVSPSIGFTRGVAYAYWPLEDEADSFRISSGLSGKPNMSILGAPVFATYSGFHESAPLLKIGDAQLSGRVTGNPTGYVEARFMLAAPESSGSGRIISLYGSGDVARWDLINTGLNAWQVVGLNEADLDGPSATYSTGSIPLNTNGEKYHGRIRLIESGADVLLDFEAINTAGESLGTGSATFAGAAPLGRIYRVTVNENNGASVSDIYMGHIAVYGPDFPSFEGPINSWHYEEASDRIERICAEEGVEFRKAGGVSAFMGYQNPDSPQAIMSTSAVTDTGYLTDPLDAFGVEYRTGRSLFNQAAHLTLSYTGNELSGELRPVSDDSYLMNDSTVSRGEAGSARFRLESGPLSILEPPLGVGTYADSQSYSLAHEGQCVDLASWGVHQGTLDEEHYNRIEIALENARIAADPALIESILTMDVGKRLDVTDTPDFLPADDIRQLVIGYEEWFDNFQHDFRLNTIAERVFETAQYDTDYRFDTAGSTLYSDVSATATSLPVSVNSGPVWSTSAADFDVWIDGERVTVTSVANDTTTDTSDSFNRADSTTNLGSTDGGVVQAWVQNVGTWGINGNRAYVSAAGNSIATVAGTADFENLDVEVPVWSTGEAWLVFRFTDTSNFMRWGGTAGSVVQFESIVGGVAVRTDVTSMNTASGLELKVRCTGSVIELYVDDVLELTVSETDNLTATRVGMQTQNTTNRFNAFTFDAALSPQTFTATRSVNGISAPHSSGAEVSLYQRPYRGL